MDYEQKIGEWSGPLEKLLELIEGRKLDVSEVSLAQVTDDFLKYLEHFRKGGEGEEGFKADLRILADFISVASRLIFAKSKFLMPSLALTGEEEAEIKDLERRLRTYQQLKPALKTIAKLWRSSHKSYSRPYFLGRGSGLAEGQSVFYPGRNLDLAALAAALNKISESFRDYGLETQTIREKIVSLEEKIQEVLERVRGEGDMRFKNLSTEKSRAEMIVIFLAVLHLAREQLVLLEQLENFSDIMVKKK